MYEAPKLLRFGSFRDLTKLGYADEDDHLGFRAIAGCNWGACPDPGVGVNVVEGSR